MRIPLFPLRLVVFPDEKLNLHIFDPKYLTMIDDCIRNGETFGIPAYIDNTVMKVGTEMKVLEVVNEYESGERDIKTVAVGLFEIDSIHDKATKFNCEIGKINPYFLINDQDDMEVRRLVDKVNVLFRSLNVKEVIASQIMKPVSFSLGHVLGLSLKQEYELLCYKKESDRIKYLTQYIDGIMPEEKVKEIIMRKINLNGHFKNAMPPH
jgi:ATP-dependent Lon protease